LKSIYLAAILNGIVSTMLGPLMPGFEAKWALDDAEGGLLFVAQFVAIVIASAAVAALARRFGYRTTIAGGLAIAALGVAGCATASWTLAMTAIAVTGIAMGMAIPASNLAMAGAAQDGGSARRVLYLNMFWSIGAVTAPALVASLGRWFLPSLACAFVGMAVVVAATGPTHRPVVESTVRRIGGLPHVLFALMLFLYVGTESAVAGWASSYAMRSAESRKLWAVLPAVFWGSILLGRVVAPRVVDRVKPAVMAPWCLGVALLGATVLLADEGPVALLAGSSIAGLGLSPIFPVTVAGYADRVGGSVSGLVFSAAGLGGAAVPAMVGVVSKATGSLRMGLATVLALLVAMIWLQGRVRRA
jgi:fucose permease